MNAIAKPPIAMTPMLASELYYACRALQDCGALTLAIVSGGKASLPAAQIEAAMSRVTDEQTMFGEYAAQIQEARDEYESDEIEIDDTPAVSPAPIDKGADSGVWVAAWVWVQIAGNDD